MKKNNMITKEALAKIAKDCPESIDSMMTIVTDGTGKVRTFLMGIDKLGMSPGCVEMVAAMHGVMDGQLAVANAIYGRIKEEGEVKVCRKAKDVTESSLFEDMEDEFGGDFTDRDFDKFIGLIDTMLGRDIGGGNDAAHS